MKDKLRKIKNIMQNSDVVKNEKDISNVTFGFDKHCEVFYIVHKPKSHPQEKVFDKIIAYKLKKENNKYYDIPVLFLDYTFNREDRSTWIHNIKVTHKDYLNLGVGTYLLKVFEKFAYENFKPQIQGKYYPEEPANGKDVEKFYLNNDYYIDRYDNWALSKTISKDEYIAIKANIVKVEDINILGPIKNFYKETQKTLNR